MEAPQVSPRHNASTSHHTLLNTRNVLTLSILETKEIFIWSGPSTSTSTKFNKDSIHQEKSICQHLFILPLQHNHKEKMCAQVVFSNRTLFRNLKSTPTEGNILEKDNYPVEHLVQKALQKVLITHQFCATQGQTCTMLWQRTYFSPY